MKMRSTFLALVLLFSISSMAQTKSLQKTVLKSTPPETASTACDCIDAIKINVTKATRYGLTKPPLGFGTVQEIISSKTNKLAFETEHNTAWYLLNINFDGEFVFDIIPQDSTNDYDFLLYKYTDTNFCKQLQKNNLKPLRSNLSRLSSRNKGITGLSSEAKTEFVGEGIGAAYSKSVKVVKGEKYVLVLDNVYPDGKGHTIRFNSIKQVSVSGIVLDADSVPIKAEISFSDYKGNIITQLNTEKDGKYIIKAGIEEGFNYSLTFSSDSSFIDVKTINTNALKNSNAFTDIRTILVKLKKGMKYNISSINFYGNQAVLLPSSYASVLALCKLMEKNKKMIIRAEGHVNGLGNSLKEVNSEKSLSEERAKTVYNYLKSQGIEAKRMSTTGYGADKMLYPTPSNELESSANRRVEINVISIE